MENFGLDKYISYLREIRFENYNIENIGRVLNSNSMDLKVQTRDGPVKVKLKGNLINSGNLPVVGDWVSMSIEKSTGEIFIEEILPRKNYFSRKASGSSISDVKEQLISANIDYLFIVTDAQSDFNLNRLERYLVMARQKEVEPVLIINKIDLNENYEKLVEIAEKSLRVDTYGVSVRDAIGIDTLRKYFAGANTIAIVGSSGVGKSSFINLLLGSGIRETNETQKGGRGKHTTVDREMIVTKEGGIFIDNPGMRELQLWHASEGIEEVFEDIELLARECKFKDCEHVSEPGCKVNEAIELNIIEERHFKNYLKLKKELAYIERQENILSQVQNRKQVKSLHKSLRNIVKKKRDISY